LAGTVNLRSRPAQEHRRPPISPGCDHYRLAPGFGAVEDGDGTSPARCSFHPMARNRTGAATSSTKISPVCFGWSWRGGGRV